MEAVSETQTRSIRPDRLLMIRFHPADDHAPAKLGKSTPLKPAALAALLGRGAFLSARMGRSTFTSIPLPRRTASGPCTSTCRRNITQSSRANSRCWTFGMAAAGSRRTGAATAARPLTATENSAVQQCEKAASDDQVTTPAVRGAFFSVVTNSTRRRMTHLALNWTELNWWLARSIPVSATMFS
jgi:hypothetical protein